MWLWWWRLLWRKCENRFLFSLWMQRSCHGSMWKVNIHVNWLFSLFIQFLFFQLFFIYLDNNGKEIPIAMMKTTLQDVIMMGEIVVEEVRFIALYVNASKWLVDKWFFSPGYMGTYVTHKNRVKNIYFFFSILCWISLFARSKREISNPIFILLHTLKSIFLLKVDILM